MLMWITPISLNRGSLLLFRKFKSEVLSVSRMAKCQSHVHASNDSNNCFMRPIFSPTARLSWNVGCRLVSFIFSRVAVSVVGIDNGREGQRSSYQIPPVAGQNSIKIGSFPWEQKSFTSSYCNAYFSVSYAWALGQAIF
jgi:hypothetical protein